jgi:hypothetical protein
MTTLSRPKKPLISEIQIDILIELTIYGSIMIQFPIVTQHHIFSREINMKKSSIQIGVMQNSRRFSSIRKYYRPNLVVTNNMSTYEN